MNESILLTMKWLNNKSSVSARELGASAITSDATHVNPYAIAYAVADYSAYSVAMAANANYAKDAKAAAADITLTVEGYVNSYFESSGENKQAYTNAI